MLQSASIRLNFWLLGTSQLDLHLLDCSIGMDAYCLMYYWFDLMSAHGLIWPYLLAQMCIILFAEVSAHIPSSSNPLNHMHQEKKKEKVEWSTLTHLSDLLLGSTKCCFMKVHRMRWLEWKMPTSSKLFSNCFAVWIDFLWLKDDELMYVFAGLEGTSW